MCPKKQLKLLTIFSEIFVPNTNFDLEDVSPPVEFESPPLLAAAKPASLIDGINDLVDVVCDVDDADVRFVSLN